jgi:predicted transcriptional regulator
LHRSGLRTGFLFNRLGSPESSENERINNDFRFSLNPGHVTQLAELSGYWLLLLWITIETLTLSKVIAWCSVEKPAKNQNELDIR